MKELTALPSCWLVCRESCAARTLLPGPNALRMAKTAFFEVLPYRTPTTGSTPAVSCHTNGLQVVLKSHHQSIHSSIQLFGVLGTNHQSGFLDFLCLLSLQVELYHILLIGICSMRPHILLQELTVKSSESLS